MDSKLTKKQQKKIDSEVKKQVAQQVNEKIHQKLFKKSTASVVYLGSEFKKQASTAMIAAFGFLIALVWRDLIVKAVDAYIRPYLSQSNPLVSDFLSAFLITLIAVIGIALIAKWAKSPTSS